MTAGVMLRDRARQRNMRAVLVSLGMLAFAVLCGAIVLSGIGGGGHTSTHRKTPRRPSSPRRAAPVTTTSSPPTATTASTVTTLPYQITVASDTASPTLPPIVGTIPPTLTVATTSPTTRATTTTTVRAVSAAVRITDTPNWCTAVVTLSTGASSTFDLAPYLAVAGDSYEFDATIAGFTMHVTTKVVTQKGTPTCVSSVSAPTHGP